MKKTIFLFLASIGAVTAMAVSAMAVGLGGYMTVGGGGAKYKYDQFELYTSKSLFESTNTAAGGGIVFDTTCGSDGLFNYRLRIGGEQNWVDRETEMKLSRFHLQNVFGFGVVRTRMIRFWLGPTFGCSYTWGKRTSDRYFFGLAIPNILWYQSNPLSSIFDYDPGDAFDLESNRPLLRDRISRITYGGIDIGFVLGLNINLLEYLTFGPELGFRYGFNWGKQEREICWYVPTEAYYIMPINYGETKKTLTMHGYEFYLNLSVMYRMGS